MGRDTASAWAEAAMGGAARTIFSHPRVMGVGVHLEALCEVELPRVRA